MLRRLASRHSDPLITHAIQNLDRRVTRLLHQPRGVSSSVQDSSCRIIRLLDSIDYAVAVNIELLAFECMAMLSDARSLASVVLNWTSSLYREGSHRVYLATRLLRRWCHQGVDIDSAILSYFTSIDSNTRIDPHNIFRVIAELVRSKTFSVGKYLQWLIATGSISRNQDFTSVSFLSFQRILSV